MYLAYNIPKSLRRDSKQGEKIIISENKDITFHCVSKAEIGSSIHGASFILDQTQTKFHIC